MKSVQGFVGCVVRKWVRMAMLCAMVAAGLLAPGAVMAGAVYSNVYAFGDSLMDVGNVYTATAGSTPVSPPYYQGRWSNGPLAIDNFAAHYGVVLTPSVLGGTNYAWGGARAESTLASGVPDTIDQVNLFVAGLGGTSADKNAVYVLDGGGNDIIPALQSLNPAGVLQTALNAMRDSVAALLGAGARNILLLNVPDVGKAPDVSAFGASAAAGATFLTQQYNQGLALIEQGFDAQGFDVDLADLFAVNSSILANPGAFGFSNVTSPCLVHTGGVFVQCANPDEYLYWDGFHPTAATGRVLTGELLRAVPEPGTLVLLVVAFLLLAACHRRSFTR